jgi:hypothetical protein
MDGRGPRDRSNVGEVCHFSHPALRTSGVLLRQGLRAGALSEFTE